ncbi:tryptophan synthase alpha chain [Desulfosalsimonas propionicica]|uniref:Tryptophan synthase alpha chain n=1 Tax=Desulfosalsimonas propionicica TaxID=332175 RepID=A0A7W0HK62_9BACT|nr:tryptophan synthase subunit alpha [Desulfosalsimonas propionicica]MBA2880892.1 tryptophan synthase alpha chain [Desulfosalsimonas propionicica]
MTRIEQSFARLTDKGEKALVGFVTAGDPDMETSLSIVSAMCENGMDILELGVPFSDPTADGPVIQRSSARALKAGMNLGRVLEMTRQIRQSSDVPIVLFSYYNPIMAYGIDAFYKDSVAAGADGVLVVDLPPEESDELTGAWAGGDFSLIRLVAPTTPEDRMQMIAGGASGFLYMVSMTGVTGSGGLDFTQIGEYVDKLKNSADVPVCVGFGISTPADVAAVSGIADGVVIGSAFERTIEENEGSADLPAIIGKQTAAYKEATRG